MRLFDALNKSNVGSALGSNGDIWTIHNDREVKVFLPDEETGMIWSNNDASLIDMSYEAEKVNFRPLTR